MASLKDVGERELVRKIHSIVRPCNVVGTNDDAAILDVNGTVVVSTDIVTFERHMPKGMSYEQFGWTAAAVNFSDLASMGARPIGILASLALPQDLDESAAYDIMNGIDMCAEYCNTNVIGGDTKPGTGMVACTALGTMDDRKPMVRSGASVGDVIAVTGPLGSPAAQYNALMNDIELDDTDELMTPDPKVWEGMMLAESGVVTSCMDLSDGLGTALNTICEQSHVGMEIEYEFLPEGKDVEEISERTHIPKKDLLLGWGGEYELVFTFKEDGMKRLFEKKVPFTIIGLVTNGNSVYLTENDTKTRVEYGSY